MSAKVRRKLDWSTRAGRAWVLGLAVIVAAAATFVIAALLVNINTRRNEQRTPFVRLVEVDESTTDPAKWGQNWPREFDSYKRTADAERTRYGGSDAIPEQKLDKFPWLKVMYSGYAFALDYRDKRGHAYMLSDQGETERVKQKPQPGACLHCHASIIPAYRAAGNGDVMEGFKKVNAMPYAEARGLKDGHGQPLINHPVSCVDCHDPATMAVRVTRPGFIVGIAKLKAHQGIKDYDVNRDATRQEMRTYACAQCHVEYYFAGKEKMLTYPWEDGIKVEEIEGYYAKVNFTDWKHGATGAPMLKAQHPEFEMYSQGTHARAGVSCADCHMPYKREGAMKVSDHNVRSPLLNVQASCQTCHAVPEKELLGRAETIQARTVKLTDQAATALMDLIAAIQQAKAAGASDSDLDEALKLHRSAQWRLDFVSSENSHGFHADQESARILAESIDLSRRGQIAALRLHAQKLPAPTGEIPPVEGVTPKGASPPGPYQDPSNPRANP